MSRFQVLINYKQPTRLEFSVCSAIKYPVKIGEMAHMAVENLNILLVGSGGRESALAWKLSQSPKVKKIYVVPGNGGTASLPKTSNIDVVSGEDYPGLVDLSKRLGINLVVPGPDVPVVEGIEGHFKAGKSRHSIFNYELIFEAGIPCFGPSKAAARLEGSKVYAKDFMNRHSIPTAEYRSFRNYDEAKSYLDGLRHNIVIKASGLAAGKGVVLPKTQEEALVTLKEIMLDRVYGDAGMEVVIEELLEGEEVSILTFSDGHTFKSLLPAQDHKRIFDNDQGPNTGGMGCYAPTKVISIQQLLDIDAAVLEPTFFGLRKEGINTNLRTPWESAKNCEGTPFVGVLFTGLMLTKSGPKVLEYNVRFGDPETQTLIPLLTEDTDLAEVMIACVRGDLKSDSIKMNAKASAVVCVVSGGYPGAYATGVKVEINETATGEDASMSLLLNFSANSIVTDILGNLNFFHAGTKLVDGEWRTSGGRVMAVSATADTLKEAVELAYEGVSMVHFEGMFYRRDIARR